MSLIRRTPMKRGGFKAQAFKRIGRKEANAVAKVKPMKSRGMKGRPPTVAEQAFMDAMASLGCLACAKDGIANSNVSLHHVDGRVKPGCHFLVLALCAGHHQDKTGEDKTLIAVHPYKKQFERRYGTQLELLEEAKRKLWL